MSNWTNDRKNGFSKRDDGVTVFAVYSSSVYRRSWKPFVSHWNARFSDGRVHQIACNSRKLAQEYMDDFYAA